MTEPKRRFFLLARTPYYVAPSWVKVQVPMTVDASRFMGEERSVTYPWLVQIMLPWFWGPVGVQWILPFRFYFVSAWRERNFK